MKNWVGCALSTFVVWSQRMAGGFTSRTVVSSSFPHQALIYHQSHKSVVTAETWLCTGGLGWSPVFLSLCYEPESSLSDSFPVLPKCGSRVICRELCWHWAAVCDGRNHSLRTPVSLSVSSTCAVLHVLAQLHLGLTPVPPLAGGETFMSSFSPLLGHPFPRALGLSSPIPHLWVLGVTLSATSWWRCEQN